MTLPFEFCLKCYYSKGGICALPPDVHDEETCWGFETPFEVDFDKLSEIKDILRD